MTHHDGTVTEPSLLEQLRTLKAKKPDEVKADDIASVFASILKEAQKPHPNRDTMAMTPERSALVDKIHIGMKNVIGEALIEHGPDKAMRQVLVTALGMLVNDLDEVYPKFARSFLRILDITLSGHAHSLESLLVSMLIDDGSLGEAHRA